MLDLKNVSLKNLAQFGAAVTILVATSACTHQQLKEESELAAATSSEEAGFENPTPDVASTIEPTTTEDESTDLSAYTAETPGWTPAAATSVSHGKVAKHKVQKHKHAKQKKMIAKKSRRAKKTMVAAAGTVNNTPTLPPPTEELNIPTPPSELEAPPVAPELPVALEQTESSSSDVWLYAIGVALLAGLAGMGYKLHAKNRGSRRLVFN